VVVSANEQGRDALGFEYLDGPVTPKPEKLPAARVKAKRKPPQRKPRPPSGGAGGKGGPGGSDPSGRGSVPKVPLKA
jgi:ATP-dependent Clp protease ATP-binding subunit ClpA